MLGKSLRLKIAIVLAVLGLLMLGSGIGQRTIWLPPETLTATVPADVTPAPVTVIGPELLKTRDGSFTLTVKNDGPIQLAVGRPDDIIGWISDAAYTSVGSANDDFSALTVESAAGTDTVPNPSGSDLWVSEDKGTGELTYRWQAPSHGDWSLLLSSDGTAPAPADISMTVENDSATPWAVPLMIIGSALLALAALLLFISLSKPQTAAAVAGRRSAGRTPADPATGALEVEKIVAARRKAQSAATQRSDTKATGTERTGTATNVSAEADTQGADAAVETKRPSPDATSALPALLTTPGTTKPPAEPEDKDDSGDAAGPSGGTSSGAAGTDAAASSTKRAPKARTKGAPKDTTKGGSRNDGKAKFFAPAAEVRTVQRSVKARWGAVLAATLLAGSVSPAVADDATAPAPSSSASVPATLAPGTAAPATAAPATAGFPNLLDSQIERIAADVAAVVESGDNAKNAKELQPRVAGMALQVRTANYKIRAKVAKQAAVEPVNATKLLAKVVTTTRTWPRSVMLVTQGENNVLPQLMTLVQDGPRANYKLIQATPLLPGQTFPTVDKEGTQNIPLDAESGLKMSPQAAISALSDRLTKADSKFKGSFNDSVYINSVLDLQKKVAADAKDASYVFSHKADLDAAVALRTADGGAMVVVGNSFGIAAASKDEATLTVGEDAAVFTGSRETTKGFTLTYAEPVVMYIPPASESGSITILSATRHLVGGTFK